MLRSRLSGTVTNRDVKRIPYGCSADVHHALRYKTLAEHLIQCRVIHVIVWLRLPIPVNSALVSTLIVYAMCCNGISALSDIENDQEGSDVEEACAVKRRTWDVESTDDDMDSALVANTHHGQAGHMPNGGQLNTSPCPFQVSIFWLQFFCIFTVRLHVMQCMVFRRPFCLFVSPSVCLSVCQTHALWQNKRNLCQILIPYERSFILVF